MENGGIYRGKTYILNNPRVHIYWMLGPNETMYWVRFSSHEYLHKTSLHKTVRLGNFYCVFRLVFFPMDFIFILIELFI